MRHRASTAAGVRKHVPELISVVPPTALPSGSRIGGRPTVATWPASRYSRVVISRGRAVNESVSSQRPSSSSATRIPPSASSLAATAPPAPAPITQASTAIVVSPCRSAPSTTRRCAGWKVPVPSR